MCGVPGECCQPASRHAFAAVPVAQQLLRSIPNFERGGLGGGNAGSTVIIPTITITTITTTTIIMSLKCPQHVINTPSRPHYLIGEVKSLVAPKSEHVEVSLVLPDLFEGVKGATRDPRPAAVE